MTREFFTPERKRWIARDCGGSGDQGHSHARATTRISPAFAQRLRRARRARTNWPKPIDSIARRFVTIRVIRVSNPSERDQLQRRAQREFIRASRWSSAFQVSGTELLNGKSR